MNTTIKRIQSDTPPFFKRMRPWAYFIAAIAGSMAGVTKGFPGCPEWVTLIFAGIGTIALAMAGFTYLTTTDPDLAKE